MYSVYNLKENPFPQTGSLDPFSLDPRENGTIFQPDLFEEKVVELANKIEDKLNIIYIMGLVHERGTGKSAILVNQFRKLNGIYRDDKEIWSTYLRCTNKDNPEKFCNRIIEQWHSNGLLWSIFERILLSYSKATNSLSITESSIKVMFRRYTSPPKQVNLMRFFHVRNVKLLSSNITRYLYDSYGLDMEIVGSFIETYLSSPSELMSTMTTRRIRSGDDIEIFGEILKLTNYFGDVFHYIFIDQLEDLIAVLTNRTIVKFSLSMRRILEKSQNLATYVVTLHPDSDVALDGEAGRHLTTIAPLAPPYRVDLLPLNWQDDTSIKLVETYLEFFRINQTNDALFPFTPNAIKLITLCKDGCIRDILRRFYFTIEFALKNQADVINEAFLLKHPIETIGSIITERQKNMIERLSQ